MSTTEDLREVVQDELTFDPLVDAASISVKALHWDVSVPPGLEATARDGNLTLAGSVRYGAERTAAELAVGGLTGIRNIQDNIDVDDNAADQFDVTG